MDDARLPGGMTLDDIAKRLETLHDDVRTGLLDAKQRDEAIHADLVARLRDVDSGARIRDERSHELLKFNLEAREALRESMQGRFDAVERKQDQDISLLKDVLRHLAATRQSS